MNEGNKRPGGEYIDSPVGFNVDNLFHFKDFELFFLTNFTIGNVPSSRTCADRRNNLGV